MGILSRIRNDLMKYFIWDLDGTLIDSYGVIISSLKEALEENNLFFTTEEIKKEILSKTVSNFLSNLEEKGLINKKKINRVHNKK